MSIVYYVFYTPPPIVLLCNWLQGGGLRYMCSHPNQTSSFCFCVRVFCILWLQTTYMSAFAFCIILGIVLAYSCCVLYCLVTFVCSHLYCIVKSVFLWFVLYRVLWLQVLTLKSDPVFAFDIWSQGWVCIRACDLPPQDCYASRSPWIYRAFIVISLNISSIYCNQLEYDLEATHGAQVG